MKTNSLLLTLSALVLAGCVPEKREHRMPAVVTGEAILGTAWKNPAGTTPSNEGSGFTGSKVEIYENSMVVITSPSGTRQVTTLSHITDLTLKPAVKNP